MTRIVYFLMSLLVLGGVSGPAEAGTSKLGREVLTSDGLFSVMGKANCSVEHCKNCAANGKCRACDEGYVLKGGACVSKCPDGKTWHSVLNKCTEAGYGCDAACADCVNGLYCKTCKDGFVLVEDHADGMASGRCHAQCTTLPGCEICGDGKCFQCADGYKLVNGECVPGCKDGYVFHPLIKKCVVAKKACESKACLKCVDGLYCTECYSSAMVDPETGMCVSRCPVDYEWNDTDQKCYPVCKDGYVFNPAVGNCVKREVGCEKNCAACVGGQYCSECEEGYELDKTGLCSTACEAGQFWDPQKKGCRICPEYCSSCEGVYQDDVVVDVVCTSCEEFNGTKLIDKQCAKDEKGYYEGCLFIAEGCFLKEKFVNNSGRIRCPKDDSIICKMCEDGYVYNEAKGNCMKESIEMKCPAESHCTYCAEGCFLHDGSIAGGDGVCYGKETFAVCKECEEGYMVDEKTGTCVKQKDLSCPAESHCTYCAEGCFLKDGGIGGGGNTCDGRETFAVCKECEAGYQVDFKTGTCEKIIQDKCPAGSHCTYCAEGCIRKDGSIAGGGNACDGYETFAVCKECEDGYQVDFKTGTCVKEKTIECKDPNCTYCTEGCMIKGSISYFSN